MAAILARKLGMTQRFLEDGRVVEGELHVMSGRYEVGAVTFDQWEIETLEDVT